LADKMYELGERWQHRMTFHRHTLAENYLEGGATLICDLDVLVSPQFFGGDQSVHDEPRGDLKFLASLVYSLNTGNEFEFAMGNQGAVLVFDVELVNSPDRLPSSSLVRLYKIHDEVDDIFGGVIVQSTIYGGNKFIPGVTNCKFGEPCGGTDHVIHGEVQRSSEIVDRIADDTEDFSWNNLNCRQLYEIVTAIRVRLDGNNVTVVCGDLRHARLQILRCSLAL